MTPPARFSSWILPIVVAAVILGVIGYVALGQGSVPRGPVDLVWDKTACAECQMHVGEPAFAAQLVTVDGRVLAFDDPGCLILHLPEIGDDVAGIWFHHLREDGWIPAGRVRFVEVEPTPMGYGIGAVTLDEAPGGMTLEVARERVRTIAGGR